MSQGPAVFAPKGRIDGTTAAGVERELLALLKSSGPHLIFDLSDVDYLSSAGLRVILVAAKNTRASGGKTVLCSARPLVLDVLKMSGFERILKISATVEGARQSMG